MLLLGCNSNSIINFSGRKKRILIWSTIMGVTDVLLEIDPKIQVFEVICLMRCKASFSTVLATAQLIPDIRIHRTVRVNNNYLILVVIRVVTCVVIF